MLGAFLALCSAATFALMGPSIQISTQPDVRYDVLIQTLDAARETRPGARDLFPEPQLGVLR